MAAATTSHAGWTERALTATFYVRSSDKEVAA